MKQFYSTLTILFVALLPSTQLLAQLENSYWFFGNSSSGIYFDPNNGNQPVANNVQYTPFGGEGCGVVTDPVTGQLLFYSDGERVLNRNNVPMPNGTTLGGCSSSAQAVAFAMVPGSCNRYYIFSNTSGSGCATKELRWSIVNMDLDNGLGDIEVATKNTLVRTDVTEGMLMVQKPGVREYWLIGKMTNNTTFFVYQITTAGITLAGQYPGLAAFNYNIQYSPVAGKLVVCYPSGPVVTYDFDTNTGAISNQVQVASVVNAYDAEFSPDGTKLYYSGWNSLSIGQYDYSTNTNTVIFSNGLRGGGLRTGPDGKIYHVNNNFGTTLAVINNPNAAGAACGYVDNAVNVGVPIGGLNLPEILAGYIPDIVTGITTGTINNVSCFGGSDGKAWASASNGAAPYTYNWSDNTIGDTLRNVAPGTYYITITDAVQCKVRDTVVITEPTALTLNPLSTNIQCNGQSTGSVDLQPAGGTTPYTALWNDNNTDVQRLNMVAGNYSVTLTDANSCTQTATITLTQNTAISLTETHTNVSCNGANDGTANLTVSGGQTGYTFNWSDNVYTQNRTNMAPGLYSVTVYDGYQCPATLSLTITEPPLLAITNTHTDVACFGGSTGSITTTVTGGAAPYTYLWSSAQLTPNLTNQAAGNYSATVTDINGCTATTSATIAQPAAALSLSRVVTNASCNGIADGAIDITIAGGTPPYTYLWSNNATTEDISNLAAGIYRPTATDANGCSITATITVAEPNAMQLDVLEYNTSCSYTTDGEVEIDIVGGTSPYTWSWADGNHPLIRQNLAAGNYTISVTDDNGCTATTSATVTSPNPITLTTATTDVLCYGDNTGGIALTVVDAVGGAAAADYLWSNGAQTQNNSNIPAGSFTVSVTDQNQCSATATATVNQPAAPLNLTSNQTYVLCYGESTGAVDLTPSGGTGPYTYLWNNNATTQDISNLPAGTYSVSVNDANNCSATLSAVVQEPVDGLSLTSTSIDASCAGFADGSIDLTPTGATTPYTYIWSNFSTQEDPNNLPAGNFTVTVTDANGCTATHTETVGEPDALLVSLQATDLACNGDADASITSTVTGGLQLYEYTWSTGDTTPTLRNVGAGTYDVLVTDRNQCIANASIVITEPDSITYTYQVTDVSCYGAADGSVSVTTSGGTGIIDAIWVGGVYPDNVFTGIDAANYTIILRDENACEERFSFAVSQPDSIFVNVAPMDTLKVGELDTMTIVEQTNPGSVTYLWEPATGLSCTDCATPEIRANFDTQYTLTIDNNGCYATDTVWVYVDGRILYVPNAFSPNGDNQNDVLYVYAEGVKKTVWSVYNRWGEAVFTSNDIDFGWDGTLNGELVPPGVFVIDVYIEYLDLTSHRITQSIIVLR